MVGTLDSRDIRYQDRPVLAGIEVAPAPRPTVVPAACPATFRARPLGHSVGQVNSYFAQARIQLHVDNLPRGFDAEYSLVEILVVHPITLQPPAPRPGHTCPHNYLKAPKRALSYDGVILLTGSTVDPGYQGHLLFGLYNASQRRVLIRSGRKLCNIVFERLSSAPEKLAPTDTNLMAGSFPDAFLDRIANMDVLPWMQISERVKQIEAITKDIIDLKARYDDVLQPIRDLTANVSSLTQDVSSLASQTKAIAKDVESVNSLVTENNRQIAQLTANLGVLTGSVQVVQQQSTRLEASEKAHSDEITDLKTDFGRYKVIGYIFWGVILLVIGAGTTLLLERAMK